MESIIRRLTNMKSSCSPLPLQQVPGLLPLGHLRSTVVVVLLPRGADVLCPIVSRLLALGKRYKRVNIQDHHPVTSNKGNTKALHLSSMKITHTHVNPSIIYHVRFSYTVL